LVLLPSAELLLPPLPRGGLPHPPARVLRRRRPRDPAPWPGDDVPGDAPPAGLPPDLPPDADPGVERPGDRGPARLRRLQLPAVPPGLGPVPHGLRDAAPLRLSAPRDPPPLLAGDELHRLLAPDQHLLEGFHGPALLQPGGLPSETPAAADRAGGRDSRGLPGDVGPAWLPVLLAAGRVGLHGPRRAVLGDAGRARRRKRATRRPPAPGDAGTIRGRPRRSRILGPRFGRARPQGRGYVRHDRAPL